MVLNIIIIISISLKIFFDIKYHRLLNKEINKNIKDRNSYKIGVSIIICCKNEIQNLQENLKFIVSQNYDYFEIIIVDDGSIDKTDNYIKENFPSVRIIKTYDYENKYPGKKNALGLGINAAKNEIILLTDADCKPISKEWIKGMIEPFKKKETEIVLGLSPYKTYNYSLLNKIIQYDSFITAINYCSFTLANQPYMGIGRNLAYRKKSFLNSTSLKHTERIASGDDDLLINEISSKVNTKVCFAKNAITVSDPKKTWKSYIIQKRRHYSTPKLYKRKDQILLSLNYISYLIIPSTLIYSIVNQYYFFFIIIWAYKLITNKILLSKFSKKLSYNHLLWYSPILEIILIGLQPIIYLTNSLIPTKRWK